MIYFYSNFKCKVPVAKWRLKYSGESTISIKEFLGKVTFHMRARHVSEMELLYSAYDLFTSSALNRYQANYFQFTSGNALETALKAQFLLYLIMIFICGRKLKREPRRQNKNLALMEKLFQRITVYPDERQKLSVKSYGTYSHITKT